VSVDSLINEFIEKLAEEEGAFPYLYNVNKKTFNTNKDWVLYSGPVWDLEEPKEAIKAFIKGRWLASGENVYRFEKEFSQKHGFSASLMVNSGSSANLVMIAALKKYKGWMDEDEVVVSPVGFPTTIAPLVQNNLKPVFADIDIDDLNFDLDKVKQAITNKTKAIFISPVLGNPPNMDDLQGLAEEKNLMLILDGCDSLGSKWRGKDLSDYAFSTSCSFYPAHHITTGEGGMVSSKDEGFIAMARSFAWWGRDCWCVGAANLSMKGTCGKRFDTWLKSYDGVVDHKYIFSNIGYNLKPLDMQGAIGLAQMKKLDYIHEKRRSIKTTIEASFVKHLGSAISIPQEREHAETSWFGVPVICHKNKLKSVLVEYLESNRVQTRNYFAGNILMHPGYAHLDDMKKYPNANRVLDQVFFVGCHPSYTIEMLEYVDRVLENFSREKLELFLDG
jgi:CDP-4-dehydro-6-deoxyglucose reductase, E1